MERTSDDINYDRKYTVENLFEKFLEKLVSVSNLCYNNRII